jgi:hypothetical protein
MLAAETAYQVIEALNEKRNLVYYTWCAICIDK